MSDRMGWLLLTVGFVILVFFLGLPESILAAPPAVTTKVQMDVSKSTPRDVEDQTKEAVIRDYGKAWQSLEQALEQNRADLLATDFVGFAKDKWTQTVKAQNSAKLSRRIVDHGHHLEVLFYSVDGSAMQLRDTAQLEVQYLDDGKVVHKESMTARYLALLTPAENSWKVRILQEIAPGGTQQEALAGVSGEGTGTN
ncbi:MAG TPA: hypothetical protein VF135_11450 [Terriglobales bacterium]